jgi:YidC/Oxa1 family membrane protein insertase
VLDPLYRAVAWTVDFYHSGLARIFGEDNFFSWALAIVLLTMTVRLLIFPLFVKQVKSQRTMQMIAPRIRELKEKHKHDKQRLNAEMMALQKEHGNPLLGCLPIFAQIPLFLALFGVLNRIKPREVDGQLRYVATHGLSADEVRSIAEAKIGGVSLAGAINTKSAVLDFIGGNAAAIRVTAVVLILLMSLTTFLTQKQIIGRNKAVDPQQALQQKIFLYLAPIMLCVSGPFFPIGVLLYWLTTNLWSMGQQHFVLRRMPPVTPLGAGGSGGGTAGGKTSLTKEGPVERRPLRQQRVQPGEPESEPRAAGSGGGPVPAAGDPAPPSRPTPGPPAVGSRRPAGARPQKRRGKGQRRGGRR